MAQKLKVLVISPNSLPVPPVKGGAIEGLIDMIVRQNEVEEKLDLSVVSIYDKEAFIEAQQYKKTKFYWVRMKSARKVLHNRFNYFVKHKIFKRPFVDYWNNQLFSILQANEFDKVILEESVRSVRLFGDIIDKNRLVFHTHSNNSYCYGELDNCGAVIAVSNFLKQSAAQRANKPEEEIRVLPNSIDESLFGYSNEWRGYFRNKYSLSEDCVAFCFAGRIVAEKGVKEMIEAFVKFSTNEHLFIVGKIDNQYAKEMIKLSADYSDRIHFVGFIRNNQLSEFMSAMDVAVTPSIYDEVCAVVNIEYQAVGLPLITTDMGGIKEFVSAETILINGYEDVVNQLSEAMSLLSSNCEKRKSMSVAGKEFARRFTMKGYYNGFLECLK